ncbi:MAG: hypothetical protein QM619_00335 [Micropruina sp.]|uniref:hypothetical protein n=1 Tax=Micropruina sp. TaxID=2737536 RepID=UPI0039E529F8
MFLLSRCNVSGCIMDLCDDGANLDGWLCGVTIVVDPDVGVEVGEELSLHAVGGSCVELARTFQQG